MILNSNTYKIKRNFKPSQRLALTFIQLASGFYKVLDRGAAQDVYTSRLEIYSEQATIDQFIDDINYFRNSSTVYVPVQFNNEYVFGANIDYTSPINCVFRSLSIKKQGSLRGFTVEVEIEALSPSFTGSSAFPTLTHLELGWRGDSVHQTVYQKSYENDYTYNDFANDVGVFDGLFKLTFTEMKELRNWYKTNRGASRFNPAIAGVSEIFGPYRESGLSGDCRVFKIDERPYGADNWLCNIVLVEAE